MPDIRTYVEVVTEFDADGTMIPLSLTWENGTVYEIDKVLDVRKSAAKKAGSGGDRYTIKTHGQTTYLFFERMIPANDVIGRWFVERRKPKPF